MPTGHVTHQAPINRGKCYQPTIVRQDNLRNLPLFCGTAPAASVHDLGTVQEALQDATSSAAARVRTQSLVAPAAAVPVAASELCVLPPTLPILPAAWSNWAGPSGPAASLPDSSQTACPAFAPAVPDAPRIMAHPGRGQCGRFLVFPPSISPAAQAAGGLS